MGIIQYGILYNAAIQLTNTARDGARYAGIHGSEDDVATTTRNYIRNKVIIGTTLTSASLPDGNIAVTETTTTGKDDPIAVQITYDMTKKFVLPVAPWGGLANTSNRWSQYKTSVTMIIE